MGRKSLTHFLSYTQPRWQRKPLDYIAICRTAFCRIAILIGEKGYVVRYSDQLLEQFQKTYADKFGEEISLEAADCELRKLATLVRSMYPDPI